MEQKIQSFDSRKRSRILGFCFWLLWDISLQESFQFLIHGLMHNFFRQNEIKLTINFGTNLSAHDKIESLIRCILTRPSHCMTFEECVAELNNLRSSCSAASTFIKDPSSIIQIVNVLLGTGNSEKKIVNFYKSKREKKLYLNDENMIEIKYNPCISTVKQDFNNAYEQFYTR